MLPEFVNRLSLESYCKVLHGLLNDLVVDAKTFYWSQELICNFALRNIFELSALL